MNDWLTLQEVSKQLDLVLSKKDYSAAKQRLADKINELLNNDFPKLVSILYRVDVSEAKLKLLLKENPGTDAGVLIADLMIERQEQKIRSRQEHRRDPKSSDDESW